jgi:hypothetical protein
VIARAGLPHRERGWVWGGSSGAIRSFGATTPTVFIENTGGTNAFSYIE